MIAWGECSVSSAVNRRRMNMPWTETRDGATGGWRWVRSDGAAVKHQSWAPHWQWIAYEPDPSEAYLIRYSKSGKGFPRRWGSAAAAMRAVDRIHPETTGHG